MKKTCVLFILFTLLLPQTIFAKNNENWKIRKKYGQDEYHEKSRQLKIYKKSAFYRKYQNTQKSLARETQKLREQYLKEKNPKKQKEIVRQSAILFVEGFNKLFKFWDGMGYDYNYGNSYYPQVWKVACGTFVHHILEDMGMQIPPLIETKDERIGFNKDNKVYIWRAWPWEQIPHYGKEMAIHHPRHNQNPFIKNKELPFFSIAGYTWHIFIVSENSKGNITMFDALGSVDQRPFGQQLQKVFYTKWSHEDFKQWLLTAHIKLRR